MIQRHSRRAAGIYLPVMLWLFAAAPVAGAADYHVTPEGQAAGDGSRTNPWDLATALSGTREVRPGDTIWLGAGTYRGTFTSRLEGTAEKPIVVRRTPGGRATLDAATASSRGSTLEVHGNHTWFQGFEITNSASRRTTAAGGSHPQDLQLNGSVDIYNGQGHKLINLIVHHCAAGPSAWRGAIDAEAYGCIVFNNGWDAPDRGHGHAFYWQNEQGTKRLVDNVFFNQFSHGIHVYGSSRAYLNNFHIEGNIAFNNGAMSRTGHTRNILIGGGRTAENITLVDNIAYYSRGGSNIVGYGRGAAGLRMTGNYFASPRGTALEIKADRPELSGNTLVGRIGGFDDGDLSDNRHHDGSPQGGGVVTSVRPNRYEPGRAHIAVFNWDAGRTVEVKLDDTGLKQGDAFEIVDVQNYFGPPLVAGRYDGSAVELPMTGLRAAEPAAGAPLSPPHTAPEFAVFIVRPPAEADGPDQR